MIDYGLVPQLPADATKLYPKLFSSREAAKKLYRRAGLSIGQRGKTGTSSYKEILLRRCPRLPCVAVRYQPAGRRRRPRLALIDPAKVPDARAVLEATLGNLVLFEMLAGDGYGSGPGSKSLWLLPSEHTDAQPIPSEEGRPKTETKDGFAITGPADKPCEYCGGRDGKVYMVRNPFEGDEFADEIIPAAEPLHEDCAAFWFDWLGKIGKRKSGGPGQA
jgi:hypothetical protein